MIKKVFRLVCMIVMAAAFLGLFGAAGASDKELMEFTQIVINMAVCIAAFVLGGIGLMVTNR